MDEGLQYRLSGINFKNNEAIKNSERLRQLFPIYDGDIFSREKIGTGLDNLRKAYDELGYINFTSVPDTAFDEESRSMSLTIDIDEGKQFRVGAIKVLGLEDSAREQLLQSLPIKGGQIFSSQVWEKTVAVQPSLFPQCECDAREAERLDEKSGLVTFTLDFRPCTAN